jgi:dihydroflavonol-4-reductase
MSSNVSRVLVTGGTGFLGHNLLPKLIERDFPVRALVRPTSDYDWLRKLGVELAFGDVRDRASVDEAMGGCRYVIHAAGRFRFWGADPRFEETNVHGTQNVLDAATREGVEKFVHVSTIVVVGKPLPGRVIDETHPLDPQDPYQRSKMHGEERVRQQYEKHDLPAVIIRPGAFYGPYGRYAFNRLFFEDPLRGLLIKVNRGRHLTFPVFIKDAACGVISALERARPGEVYNLSGRSITHNKANQIISHLAGITTFRLNVPAWAMIALGWLMTQSAEVITHREPFYPLNLAHYVFGDWNVDSIKAQEDLEFKQVSFEEGARQTLDWYRRIGVWRGKRQPWEAE